MTSGGDPDDALRRAAGGDQAAFATVAAPYQRPLFRHCYRMLGSGLDAEEAVQDTLLRAWRRLDTYEGSGALGGWLYRIATNVCLDRLKSRRRASSDPEPWVEPIDDARLETRGDPHDELVRDEDISLAFVAALQRLPARQRACLLLHDVLGFSPPEVAEALDVSPASVNSLLFRARQAARPRPERARIDRHDQRLQDLLERYVRAWQLTDIDAFVQLVADDIRFTMPPLPQWFEGRDDVARFVEDVVFAGARPAGVPLYAGWCNGQPAFATYEPGPDGRLTAGGLQVLELEQRDGRVVITHVVSYRDPSLVVRCGLPATLTPGTARP